MKMNLHSLLRLMILDCQNFPIKKNDSRVFGLLHGEHLRLKKLIQVRFGDFGRQVYLYMNLANEGYVDSTSHSLGYFLRRHAGSSRNVPGYGKCLRALITHLYI